MRFFRKHYGSLRTTLLKGLIYGLTAIKLAVHGTLRRVSRGRHGRRVPSLSELRMALADV